MPVPVLTQLGIDELTQLRDQQQGYADLLTAGIAQKVARAAEAAIRDGGVKKFFDYYNDDIIAWYDAEYRRLNGRFIVSPISEADVVGPAEVNFAVRTTPSLPQMDIVRVAEFDGGGTSTDNVNESRYILDQAEVEDILQNGYGPGPSLLPIGTETTTSIDANSTEVDIENATLMTVVNVGDFITIVDGTDTAVIEVTAVTPIGGFPPPYAFTLEFDYVVPPSGTIAAGADVIAFEGFTDAERTAKIATNPDLQPLLESLIDQLEAAINARIGQLNAQLAAIAANEDPDGTAEFATATTNVNTSKTFLTNYLVTTDISDTGLASLATERGVRSAQITARIAQINANYTGQTLNYYDERYNMANTRGNTMRGTLRFQKLAEQSAVTSADYAEQAQECADAIDAILP